MLFKRKKKEKITSVEIAIYDECIRYPNCTVEILRNSVTGDESVGWWRNDDQVEIEE